MTWPRFVASALKRATEIADRLEGDAEGGDRGTGESRMPSGACRRADQERRRDKPREHRLQPEHQVEALHAKPGSWRARIAGSGGLRRDPSCAA